MGLSASAVQRRIKRYRAQRLLREVAVLDPVHFPATLAVVVVALERESARLHAALRARIRAATEVQQCFVLAGDWDYLLVLATRDVAHCREVADRLFGDQDYIKRYETRMVFEVVKQGLQLPTRAATATLTDCHSVIPRQRGLRVGRDSSRHRVTAPPTWRGGRG